MSVIRDISRGIERGSRLVRIVGSVVPAFATGLEGERYQGPGQSHRTQYAERQGDQTMQAQLSTANRSPGDADGDRRDHSDANDGKKFQQQTGRGQRWTHWPWALRNHWPVLMRGRTMVSKARVAATSVVAPTAKALRA